MANCVYVPDLLTIIEVWIHILLEKSTEMWSKNLLLVVITNYEHFCSWCFEWPAHQLYLQIHDMVSVKISKVTCKWRCNALWDLKISVDIYHTIACNRNIEKSRFLQKIFKLPVTLQITSVTGYCFIICKIKSLLFTLPHASEYSLLKHATSLFYETFHLKRNYYILVCLNRKNGAGRIKERTQF